MRILGMVLLGLLAWSARAEAACSGSGQTWACTAGTTLAQVASAVNSASDGATITFAAGSYSWSGSTANFAMNKGVTLICASAGSCNVAVAGTVLGMNGTCSGVSTKVYRISGFVFTGGNQSAIWFNAFNAGPCTLHNIRIDHNTFTGQAQGTRILAFGDNSNDSYFYGVIDHNTVTNSGSVLLAEFYSGSGATAPAGTRGTASNMFFEDNTIAITTMTNAGAGCIDSTGSPSIVWRYNSTTNCLLTSHGVTHGGGIVNFEIYGNAFVVNGGAQAAWQNCERCFHHQGSGETLFFDNRFTAINGKSSNAMAMTHYRSAPPATAGYGANLGHCNGTSSGDGNRPGQLGYPCKRQPGRDVNGVLQPMYVWGNRWTDTGGMIVMAVENPWGTSNPSVFDHIVANRDYYNAVSASAQTSPTSPFNGTTGMGFGTLANRPATCTTGSSADAGRGGVGYWATNEGRLYRCSATNTWSVHYTPFAYPHPLQSGSGQPLPPAPTAPTSLKILS